MAFLVVSTMLFLLLSFTIRFLLQAVVDAGFTTAVSPSLATPPVGRATFVAVDILWVALSGLTIRQRITRSTFVVVSPVLCVILASFTFAVSSSFSAPGVGGAAGEPV